ncbi:hypothetical protein [Azospirillum sp. TSO5]|uniref:hypothetical protein n=1 Tax=Azospirillum sp. TSO5 TaxID=716760 RepID=UPI000D6140C7|nr:hypothetical protein [Azospirillum sp. TSO5]PWC98032.1 hypothetical protein TSO5_03235 [Azospirillum sp. TSO5]
MEYEAKCGTLVYWDSFAGLVPCRIEKAEREAGQIKITVEVTADRGPYKRGERHTKSGQWVVPRDRVKNRRHCSTQILPFAWKVPEAAA